MTLPTFDDVESAARQIEGVAHRTPVVSSRTINTRTGAQLFFKCENLQRGGVFRVTDGLQQRYGEQRVFDAPIAESGQIAVAIGMGAYG